ncbi:Protein farnesyltransferase subunit beta, partial [Sarcoptes scabiei]
IDGIRKFLERMQQPDGSFTLHDSGEIDIRGVYCALAIAKLLRIPIYTDEDQGSNLFADSVAWILSCQNYEGGFGAAPGHEAHGGYTFCGVAVLAILDKLHLCNIDALLRWVSNRQMKYEGGFSGRTNKLVDGCYSFWNGAVIPIIQTWLARNEALQEYILVCCQNKSCGGLTDKPGRQPDFYHCCYVISGFAVAQHNFDDPTVIGVKENLLNPTHLLYNVPFDSLHSFEKFFLESPKS